jgi:hypothetical protein
MMLIYVGITIIVVMWFATLDIPERGGYSPPVSVKPPDLPRPRIIPARIVDGVRISTNEVLMPPQNDELASVTVAANMFRNWTSAYMDKTLDAIWPGSRDNAIIVARVFLSEFMVAQAHQRYINLPAGVSDCISVSESANGVQLDYNFFIPGGMTLWLGSYVIPASYINRGVQNEEHGQKTL